jgi:salicylate hydroxylase
LRSDRTGLTAGSPEHDPEKWKPISRLREALARFAIFVRCFGGRRRARTDHARTKEPRTIRDSISAKWILAVAPSRNIIVAGAGIGGLTAALAMAQRGFRVVVLDQAERLEEAGAGIQLSPNATRVLVGLDLEDRLRIDAVAPDAIDIRTSEGQILARIPLGEYAAARYGAPYWVTHRSDLQSALLEAVRGNPDIALKLGTRVEDFVVHGHGVSVGARRGPDIADETGIGLVCADGLWSRLRLRLGHREKPVYRHRVAWRALFPAARAAPDLRTNIVRLWLGYGAHVVHYPVKAGQLINIVAIVDDRWENPSWSEPGAPVEIVARISGRRWADPVGELISMQSRWHKWALYDLPPLRQWGNGPVTLLGDAAHPMLPFLAQGAAMAIEDAATLAASLARTPDDVTGAMRRYETQRRRRSARAQRGARRNSAVYHRGGSEATMRNLYLRMLGGKLLLRNYDWLYAWRPTPPKT